MADVFRTLQLRLRDSTWTIVFKSLIIVHLMIREGRPEVTLRYVAESPKRIAISTFTEGMLDCRVDRVRRYGRLTSTSSANTRGQHTSILRISTRTGQGLPRHKNRLCSIWHRQNEESDCRQGLTQTNRERPTANKSSPQM